MSKGKRGQNGSKSRKERLKKEREKIEEVGVNFTEGVWSKVFVAIGVVVFILAFYLLTLYLTSKGDTSTNNTVTEEAVFSFDKIIAGRSFSISDGEYLVVYYDAGEDTTLEDAIHTYRNADKLDLYVVDMGDPLNTMYVSEESNKNPTKASELKISGPTLIKFNGNNVEEYIEGTDNINDYLN